MAQVGPCNFDEFVQGLIGSIDLDVVLEVIDENGKHCVPIILNLHKLLQETQTVLKSLETSPARSLIILSDGVNDGSNDLLGNSVLDLALCLLDLLAYVTQCCYRRDLDGHVVVRRMLGK